MNVLKEVFDWIGTRPMWIQDAARRLFEHPEGLVEADYDVLYKLFQAEYCVTTESTVQAKALESNMVPTDQREHQLVLKSLSDLKHVNYIDPEQKLVFAESGLTIIYGANGSGKSGYARVLKKACFSRDQGEEILTDVTSKDEVAFSPEAIFNVKVDGADKSIVWRQIDGHGIQELGFVSVFDTRSARLVLSKEQELHYMPYGLDILQSLGATVLPKIKSMAEADVKKIDLSVQQFKELEGDHEVGNAFSDLGKSSLAQIEGLAVLSDAEVARGKELKALLAEMNVDGRIKTANLSAGRFKKLAEEIRKLGSNFSKASIDALKAIRSKYTEAVTAERIAASNLMNGEMMLPGTGGQAWKLLYEAARKFSTEHAYPGMHFPVNAKDARCVLCQQTLDAAGLSRMRKFDEYVSAEVAGKVKAARSEMDDATLGVSKIDADSVCDESMLKEVESVSLELAEELRKYLGDVMSFRTAVLDAITGKSTWNELEGLAESPLIVKLRDVAAGRYHEARRLRDMTDKVRRARLEKEYAALRARAALKHRHIESVRQWYGKKDRYDKLRAAIGNLSPLAYTKKVSELADQVMTVPMKQALDKEFRELSVYDSIIKPLYNSRGAHGRVLGQFVIDAPVSKPIGMVFSEGLLKAVALASFFAETDIAQHNHAMVFDDPITSLDARRMRKVAMRMVRESLRRQIIVFTHNILFANQLKAASEKLGANVFCETLAWSGSRAGGVSDGLPWDAKTWDVRINELRHLAKQLKGRWTPCPSEKLVAEMRSLYSKLRATIERVVQDVCLNGTVRRFEDYIRVENLKKVAGLDLVSLTAIVDLFHKTCDIIDGHDHSECGDMSCPGVEDLQSDLNNLDSIAKAILAQRQKSR